MPGFRRDLLRSGGWALAPLVLGVLYAAGPRVALAATAPVATSPSSTETSAVSKPYAQQVLDRLDAYIQAIVTRLRQAESLGSAGFDSRQPAIVGPAGEWLPLELVVRDPDGNLVHHPSGTALLTRGDIRAALGGDPVQVRNGELVIVDALPGGVSAVGTAVPLAEIGALLPDFSKADGAAIFDARGHLLAGQNGLSSDQSALFKRDLPQAQGSLQIAADPAGGGGDGQMIDFEIARSEPAGLVVVTRMPGAPAGEPTLTGSLFPSPDAKPLPDPPSPERLASLGLPAFPASRRIVIPFALGVSGIALGGIILLGRRSRRPEAPLAMERVDYLDALAEAPELKKKRRRKRVARPSLDVNPRPARGGDAAELDAANAALPGRDWLFPEDEGDLDLAPESAEGGSAPGQELDPVGVEPRLLAGAQDPAFGGDADPEPAREPAAAVAPEPAWVDEIEGPVDRLEDFAGAAGERVDAPELGLADGSELEDGAAPAAARTGSEESASAGADEAVLEPARRRGISLFWNKGKTPRPPLLVEAEAEGKQEPLEYARVIDAQAEDGAAAAAERASHIEAFRADRDRVAMRTARAAVPEAARRGQAEVRGESDGRLRSVKPGDVLVTKGEVQALVEKEGDRVFGRLIDLMGESETRTESIVGGMRETFKEVLEQFESLQDARKHDLTEIHDLKHDIENELANATLKVKQSEGKTTEGLVRLSDRVEDLARKIEDWISDQSLAEERLNGALAGLRSGWESQIEAQGDLRRALREVSDDSQGAIRRVEGILDREATDRRAEIDRIHLELRARKDELRDLASLAGRLEDLKSSQDGLHHRIDRAETQQRQAAEDLQRKLDAAEMQQRQGVANLERKLDAAETIETLRRQVTNDLDTLRIKVERGDGQVADVKSAIEAVQAVIREEQTALINQLYQDLDSARDQISQQARTYHDQVEELKEENTRLGQRQYHMIQLLSNLHSTIGKSDARTLEEVERLKAQNSELQQMVMHLVRQGKGAMPSAPAATPRPVTSAPPPNAAASSPARPPIPPQAPAVGPVDTSDGKPIDLWGRLVGRTAPGAEEDTQRKRRPR